MAWQSITESDVLTVVAGSELQTLRSHSLANGQDDPVTPIISQVVALVRGIISKSVPLGTTGTVPGSLLAPTLDIIAVRLAIRIGREPTAQRKAAHDAAMQLLRDVADQKVQVEEDQSGKIEQVNTVTRITTRDTLQGL